MTCAAAVTAAASAAVHMFVYLPCKIDLDAESEAPVRGVFFFIVSTSAFTETGATCAAMLLILPGIIQYNDFS